MSEEEKKVCEEPTEDQVNEEELSEEKNENQTEESTEEVSDDKTESASQEQDDYKDKWMRVTAEYQNYRTRTQKEKADLYQTASYEIVKELITVVDNFELALKNITDEKTKEGVELIYKQLLGVLEKNHVKEIPAMGLECDLTVHNKIAEIPMEGAKEGTIIDVTKKGYTQGDRVIRPADVVVAQ